MKIEERIERLESQVEVLLRREQHHHILPGSGQLVRTGTAVQDHCQTETCNCEGRKKLQKSLILWKEGEGSAWFIVTLVPFQHQATGKLTTWSYISSCPLCDKPLP